MKFIRIFLNEALEASKGKIALIAKTNMRDGFKGGNDIEQGLIIAKELQKCGINGLVLSGGFVSKAPMYVMRGSMPIKTLSHYMTSLWLKTGVRMAGKYMIPSVPYQDSYFLPDALKFREQIKDLPLIYVGGLTSRESIDNVLSKGFEFVQMGRALVNDPSFVNKMANGQNICNCKHSNYCIARMYTLEMACHCNLQEELPKKLKLEIDKLEKQNGY